MFGKGLKIVTAIAAIIGIIFSAVSYFTKLPLQRREELFEKTGGYVFGICHPDENYGRLSELGVSWVRFDIPYPYNKDGSISGSYEAFKRRAEGYKEQGFKVMAITPYPSSYIDIGGFYPTEGEGRQKTADIAVFLYEDLKDIVAGFQITNEMGVEVFTLPLTLEEASEFIGIQLKAMKDAGCKLPIGYNSAGLNETLHKLMRPYHQYCDYVGADFYYGNYSNVNARYYIKRLKKIYRITKKPIIIQEFGFLSEGKPKTDEEKRAILETYGYSSEELARADIETFVSRLNPTFRSRVLQHSSNPADWGDFIFNDNYSHFYKVSSEEGYNSCEHTPEGQASFYEQIIPELLKVNCLGGLIIYCCRDSYACWFCGQEGCPGETRWGLVDVNGNPKPAFYTVKDAIARYYAEDEGN